MTRTRIKICGITRADDLDAAVLAGADAVGFNAYPKSPRFVGPEAAARLAQALPAFVTPVVLFVNATRDEIAAYLDAYPGYVLQFHGDESVSDCEQFGNAYLKAARIDTDGSVGGIGLSDYADAFPTAQAILLDAQSEAYGGAGRTFDWSAAGGLPARRMVLAGGLTSENVGSGIAKLRPWAVDVSSGVEKSKGIKDPGKIHAFCNAVRAIDRALAGE